MFASAIPAAGSLLFLFLPPEGMSEAQTFWYILVVGCCVRTFITFFEIPSSALAPELTTDYDERTSVASYRYFFGYLGGIVMAFLTLLVFLAPTEQFPVGQLNPLGYRNFAMLGAALMFAAIVVSSAGTLHRVRYFRTAPPREKIGVFKTFGQMADTFSNRGFLAVLAFGLLKYTSVGMTSALNIYFGTYFWQFSSAQLAILTLDSLAGAFMALFLAPYLSRKFGKRNAAFGLAIIAVCFASAPYLLRFGGMMFDNGDPWLVAAVFIFSMLFQLCGVSSAILTHSMIGDIVEESQLHGPQIGRPVLRSEYADAESHLGSRRLRRGNAGRIRGARTRIGSANRGSGNSCNAGDDLRACPHRPLHRRGRLPVCIPHRPCRARGECRGVAAYRLTPGQNLAGMGYRGSTRTASRRTTSSIGAIQCRRDKQGPRALRSGACDL